MHPSQRRLRNLIVVPIAVLTVGMSSSVTFAASHHAPASQRHIKVMTRNLYLGADLTPLLAATNPLACAAALAAKVEASQPDKRMAYVAKEIEAAKPDLVALQEVANWAIYGKSPLDGSQLVPAANYDFLALLQHDLATAGMPYRVVISQDNFDSSKQLPAALVALATFSDRDVILERKGLPTSKLKVVKTFSTHYKTQMSIPVASLGVSINFDRGYEWADVMTHGQPWRFVNTHPEAYTPAQLGIPGNDVNGPQAAELAAALKRVKTPIVIAGDLNSKLHDPDLGGYPVLRKAGYHDTWLTLGLPNNAFTCCRNEDLSGGKLSGRIDHGLEPEIDRRLVHPRAVAVEIWRHAFEGARAVEDGRTEPDAMGPGPHDRHIALVPLTLEEGPGLRPVRHCKAPSRHGVMRTRRTHAKRAAPIFDH